MIASIAPTSIEAPEVRFGGIAPRHGTSPELPSSGVDVVERQDRSDTAGEASESGLGWAIDTREDGQETKATREILDTIDACTLRAAQVKGETRPEIEANRDRVAALLGQREEWKRPDEIYADEAWEICIVWRSGYGRVEIGTEEDGSITYYVRRTLSDESREGTFGERTAEEIGMVMSWLDEMAREI